MKVTIMEVFGFSKTRTNVDKRLETWNTETCEEIEKLRIMVRDFRRKCDLAVEAKNLKE